LVKFEKGDDSFFKRLVNNIFWKEPNVPCGRASAHHIKPPLVY
jgi:hypothetical protein